MIGKKIKFVTPYWRKPIVKGTIESEYNFYTWKVICDKGTIWSVPKYLIV